MAASATPTLAGKRVVLEPLLETQAAELAAAIVPGDDVFRWTNTAPVGAEAMRAWIRDRTSQTPPLRREAFLQRDAATGAAMGSTSLFDIDAKAESAEIGHTWLAAPWRRTGVNREAKLLLLTHAFDTLGLRRVQLVTDARNLRSQRAIEGLGATREGLLRNWRRDLAGDLRDSVVYSILDREWGRVRDALQARL